MKLFLSLFVFSVLTISISAQDLASELAGISSKAESGTLSHEAKKTKGRFVQTYRHHFEAGQSVLIKLESRQFAPTMRLLKGDVEMVFKQSEPHPDDRLAEVFYKFRVSESADFTIEISSMDKGSDGSFYLDVYTASADIKVPAKTAVDCDMLRYLLIHGGAKFEFIKGEELDVDHKLTPDPVARMWSVKGLENAYVVQERFQTMVYVFEPASETEENVLADCMSSLEWRDSGNAIYKFESELPKALRRSAKYGIRKWQGKECHALVVTVK